MDKKAAPSQNEAIDHMSDALLDANITTRFRSLCKAIGYPDPTNGRDVMAVGILFSAFGAMASMVERAAPAQSEAKPVSVPDITDAPVGADALEGWKFKKCGDGTYWAVFTPEGCFALARDADDELSSSRILAQLAALLAKRGESTTGSDAEQAEWYRWLRDESGWEKGLYVGSEGAHELAKGDFLDQVCRTALLAKRGGAL
ncbi:hypothetical protein [Robbsia andropogonis]|uniref:hypothetical protein n=1 Tax=Robbsia andropogonis TaxID=28092 RepID=UPI002A69EDD0|nr:hypothetical protein [Robbsia andropogonis]